MPIAGEINNVDVEQCAPFNETIHVAQHDDRKFTGQICSYGIQFAQDALTTLIHTTFDSSRSGYATGKDSWGTVPGNINYGCQNGGMIVHFDQGNHPNNLDKYFQSRASVLCNPSSGGASLEPWVYVVGAAAIGIGIGAIYTVAKMTQKCCSNFLSLKGHNDEDNAASNQINQMEEQYNRQAVHKGV